MSATTIAHWLDLSEQIARSCDKFLEETPIELDPAFESVNSRLQYALTAFKLDPRNPAKSRSLKLAINNYGNTLEMAMFRARNVIEQAQEAGVDFGLLPAPYRLVIEGMLSQRSENFTQ